MRQRLAIARALLADPVVLLMDEPTRSLDPVTAAEQREWIKDELHGRLGKTILPLSGGGIRNLRKGRAFWQVLEDADIPATVFKMPSNYPPVESKQRTLAGMNTPDLKGTYGMFSYFTNETKAISQEAGGGGHAYDVFVVGNRVEAELKGPVNTFRTDAPEAAIPFQVFTDPEHAAAKIRFVERP